MRNPYVGPRPYKSTETLYGRGDDAARLFHLLIAERIVLFYSPSGAGKTSLLQAQLAKRLGKERFDVIYDIRVGRKPGTEPSEPVNRYVLGAILSMEEALTKEQQRPLAALASITFAEYLARFRELRGTKRMVLIFDQFEEIFSDPTDLDAKREFITIVGQLLEDPSLFAIFSMREDWIAHLDDYLSLIPTRLKARQRLSLLTRAQAIEAIRKPAEEEGVDFAVAEQLAKDLSIITVMLPDGKTRIVEGPFVEPVQLQVVCYTLWEKPRAKPDVIDSLEGVSVDNALADYYTTSVKEIQKAGLATEAEVRNWSAQLITARGIRTQVLLDEVKSAGLSNDAIGILITKHIVRKEDRGGRTWFELSHDRLVNPVRASNSVWSAGVEAARERRRERIIRVAILLVIAGVIGYNAYQDRRLKAEQERLDILKHTAQANVIKIANDYVDVSQPLSEQTLEEALVADAFIDKIQEETPPAPEVKPTIRYFVKPGDNPKFRSALVDLGFPVDDERPRISDSTNCIWYGAEVAEKDVKLVAYALIRAGGTLQGIQRIAQIQDEPTVIRVGHNQFIAGEPALTVEEVEQKKLDELARPRARLLTEEGEGIVLSYTPETREGEIDTYSGNVGFRLPVDTPEVRVGDVVTFALLQNAQKQYAVAVKVRAPVESEEP